MKIIIAPDSFKASLTATQATTIIARAIRQLLPCAEIIEIPMADGGEGTVQAFLHAIGGTTRACQVTGPLGQPVTAEYAILPDGSAVLEMASAAGLPLVPTQHRNPMETTTFGLGQLITDALDNGATELIVGLGGSATNDGGCGMAQALGIIFYDILGQPILEPLTGRRIGSVSSIDTTQRHPALHKARIIAACDVRNPLLGPNGAAAIYAPQKGATPSQQRILEANMTHLADILEKTTQRPLRDQPGAGAAGGLGAAMLAFLNAQLNSGADILLKKTRFQQHLTDTHLVITGEGALDPSTNYGKTISRITHLANKTNTPVIALCGRYHLDHENTHPSHSTNNNHTETNNQTNRPNQTIPGLTAVFSICPGPLTEPQAIQHADTYLHTTTQQLIRTILATQPNR